MAPESIIRNEYKPHSDIWALGIVVLEMLTGQEAWSFEVDDDSVDFLLSRIGYNEELPSMPSNLSSEARDFVKRCLVKNTSIRWNIDELLSHPFLAADNKNKKTNGMQNEGLFCLQGPFSSLSGGYPNFTSAIARLLINI
ncbi:hypothetical protein IFM89_015432 [Coptis chinensis]|uniref:Protein kinase domain-containing protein n=1 Tax=Coptis chinensis TaxID=261450 RepID=A0A835M9T7_9MAGN|nr:hypothetical protein IFM89_015432 [Coptis chinensis]